MEYNTVTAREILDNLADDIYDESGGIYDKGERWLFRVWNEVMRDVMRTSRTVILPISLSTNTVKLPADYIDYVSIGYKDGCGNYVPLSINLNLMPSIGVEDVREFCHECGQKNLCKMFEAEEETETVVVAGQPFQKKIVRLLLPDGRYVEEITEPIPTYSGSVITDVELRTRTEVKEKLEPLECGCIPPTKENLDLLCGCGCAAAFECCATSGAVHSVAIQSPGSYMVYKEAGYIQMSADHCLNSIVLKYIGAGVCIGTDYVFPMEAQEALISGVYYRSIEKKRNISPSEKQRASIEFTRQKKLILRDRMRQRMDELVNQLTKTPRLTF